MSGGATEFVRLSGHRALAQRLVIATLTGRPVHISKIRSSSPTNPGLATHEVAFLRLLEAVTNGASLQISYSGTTITYHPGLIAGTIAGLGTSEGDIIEHNIPDGCTRGVTYFLIPLALLAPFAKAQMNIRLSGPGVITSATEAGDVSIDSFRTAILPLYCLFGIPQHRMELRVLQRSCSGGGGAVEMHFAGQVRLPKTLHLNRTPSRVRRIRGVAYSTGVPASNNSRMIYSAREVLNPLASDINIAAQYDTAPKAAADNNNKRKGGIGFGLSLVAETSSEGVIYSADLSSPPGGGVVPEDLGKRCAYQLLEIISQGGCASRTSAATVLTLMAMGSEDVGRLKIGRDVLGSEEVVGLAKDLRAFGCSSWGLRQIDQDDEGTTDYIVSVKGSGVGNVGRKIA